MEFDELVSDLCRFFASSVNEDEVQRINKQFWRLCEAIFKKAAETGLELYALDAVGMDTETTRVALGLAQ